jgi:hypothetical protein
MALTRWRSIFAIHGSVLLSLSPLGLLSPGGYVVRRDMIIFGAYIKGCNMRHLFLTFFAFFFVQCTAFSTSTLTTTRVIPFFGGIRHRTVLRVSEKDEQSNDTPLFPQLPPIGESSFGTVPLEDLSSNLQPVAFVSDKFELQYTCKVCETRNSHRVSRIGKQLQDWVNLYCWKCAHIHWMFL